MQTINTNKTQHAQAVSKRAIVFLVLFIINVFATEYVENIHYQSLVGGDRTWVHWDWILLIPTAIVWLTAEYRHKREWAWIAGILFCGVGPTLFAGSLLRNHQIADGNLIFMLLITSMVFFGLYIKSKLDHIW